MSHRQQGRDGASASPHHSGQAQPLCPQRALPGHPTALPLPRKEGRATCQLDDFDEDPVVSGGGHQLEEQRGQGKVVLGVAPGQLADDVDRCRLDPYGVRGVPINQALPRQTGRSMSVPPLVPSAVPVTSGHSPSPNRSEPRPPEGQEASPRQQVLPLAQGCGAEPCTIQETRGAGHPLREGTALPSTRAATPLRPACHACCLGCCPRGPLRTL